jgi:DNA invertase Pin-like site-specific DNA recombinase
VKNDEKTILEGGFFMSRAVREIRRELQAVVELLKVAAYCRVSSNSEDQLHSYAAQIKYYTEYIGQNPLWTLADIYCDEAVSGTKTDNREDLIRLVSDARRGKIDRVFVKNISRFARNTYDSLSLTRLLKSIGVSVYFEEQDLDTAEMDDEFLLTMQSEAAQNESLTISQNLRWSYKRRMEKGEFFGTIPAYGYKLAADQTLVVHEPEAVIVRRIFAMYLSGMGKQAIANMLNDQGVPRRYGYRKWYAHAVDYILNNERVVGDALLQKHFTTGFPFRYVQNRGQAMQYYVENSHQPIISREDFEAVKRLQISRRLDVKKSKQNGGHALTGKLICPNCGHRFRRMMINGIAYWQCSYHASGRQACGGVRYPEESLHDAFTLLIHKLAANREQILSPLISQLTRMVQRHGGTHAKIYEIDMQLAAQSEHNLIIAAHHAKGWFDAAEFAAKTGAVNQKVNALRAQRRKLLAEDENDALLDKLTELDNLLSLAEPQADFDAELFGQTVTQIVAVSSTEVQFTLRGDLTLIETITRTERRKNA